MWWLRFKGYRVIARNFKTPVGEIDMVARRGRLIAIIEVKIRNSRAEALSAITPRQQDRIIRATQIFLQQRPELADSTPRFDAMFISPGSLPIHIQDAWRLP